MKPITTGQREQFGTVVKDAARKAAEEGVTELEQGGALDGDSIQRVLEKGGDLAAKLKAFVKTTLAEMAESIRGCLKLISGAETLTLDPTDGKKTIARAGDLFFYLDGDFKAYGCDVPGKPSQGGPVQVHEMVKDGTFAQIFGGLSDNLDSLCLEQDQIIQFVEKHRKWLRTDGYGTFFLFKVNGEGFVAGVRVDSGGRLDAGVYRFSYDSVWRAESRPRVVVPQPLVPQVP